MNSSEASKMFLWRSCGEPGASWFLVWMPLVLLALGGPPSLPASMIRLLAVLLVAGLIWARGRGPSGKWPERLFVGAWAAAWAAALGTLATSGALPGSAAGSTTLLAALVVGAGWLGWVCQLRQDLRVAATRQPAAAERSEDSSSSKAVGLVWGLTALLLSLALLWENAHWGDAVVLACALSGFTAFQARGLQEPSPAH